MKNILVTGGCGFIGSNFIRFILQKNAGIRIINLDALTYAGNRENLSDIQGEKRYTFFQGDINNTALVRKLLKEFGVDTIVHFAAETHVDRSILGPESFIQTNILGTYHLLEEARRWWIEEGFDRNIKTCFHHISTDEVFGSLGPDDKAFSENTPYAPSSPYSASKAASDHLVRAYFQTYGLPVTITNCSNNYGPFQFPEKLIPLTILNALKGKALPVYGDGKQVRDWLYVEDHCRAIELVLQEGTAGETYIVGGNNQPPNINIVQSICRILDCLRPDSSFTPRTSLIQYVEDRPGHDRRYAMDITKIQRELGWQPAISLDAGLLQTVKWYLEHLDWVDNIATRPDYQGWLAKNYNQRGKNR
ncbi:MAG: dTDP-glucose 4,6-dehydratase [Anaerolineaceae bacterium]|nr:dTDP-glucose 4,6-dehydratase [Anaerolineaceae bacterium]